MQKMYCVYVIKRPESQNDPRIYYGVTHFSKRNSPLKRFQRGHKYANTYVGRFVRKYEDAYISVFKDGLSETEAYLLEAHLVPADNEARKSLHLLNECGGGSRPPRFQELSPEKQETLRKKRKQFSLGNSNLPKGTASPFAKPYRLISPEGVLFEGTCVNLLCKEKGLEHSNIYRVLSGARKQYKGWKKG